MPKIEAGSKFILLNDVEYPNNSVVPIYKDDKVGVRYNDSGGKIIVPVTPFGQWLDETDTPFASLAALRTALQGIFFFVADASSLEYDNSGSSLTSDNLQDGLTELDNKTEILANNEYKVTYFEIITNASTSIPIPTGATIQENEFGESGNSILWGLTAQNKPNFEEVLDAGGNIVTANLQTDGTFALSGTFVDPQVALVHVLKIKAIDIQNLDQDKIIEVELDDITIEAHQVGYNNTTSGMTGTNVQEAIDELEAESITDDEREVLSHLSMNPLEGDTQVVVSSELAVGTQTEGRESAFGEGDSTSSKTLAFTDNAAENNLVDVTTEARTVDGTTLTFQNNALNEHIYVGCDAFKTGSVPVQFFGLKLLHTQAITEITQVIDFQYWNGSAWTSFNYMVTDSSDQYLPLAKVVCTNLSEQIRFDNRIAPSWVANDPISSGTARFWIRMTTTQAVVQLPLIDQIKIHTNRFEINADGWVEYFGKGRPIGRLPFDSNFFQAANNSPANQDVYLSDKLGVGRLENNFNTGVTDRAAMNTYLPFDLDTSNCLKLRFSYITSDDFGGDILWRIYWSHSKDGDSVFQTAGQAPPSAPNEQELFLVDPAPSIHVQKTIEFDLDLSEVVSRRNGDYGDLIWLSIERNGNNVLDTHFGNVALINVVPLYTKWCEGGHQ